MTLATEDFTANFTHKRRTLLNRRGQGIRVLSLLVLGKNLPCTQLKLTNVTLNRPSTAALLVVIPHIRLPELLITSFIPAGERRNPIVDKLVKL